jgi:hypothetical protein
MMHFDVGEQTGFASDDWQNAMHKQWGASSKRRLATAARQKLASAAAVDLSWQPRAETVHGVKAALATAGLAPALPQTSRLVQLLFDSVSQPAPPGTRSAGMNIRQMLYRAEPYQIDIQLEAQPERNRVLITGQLLDISHPEVVGRDVQVTLSDGRENVVRTMTNQFGEFRGEVQGSGDLELSLLGLGEKPIVILLRGALG